MEVEQLGRGRSTLHQRLEERHRVLANLIDWGLVLHPPRFYNTIDFPFKRQSCQRFTRNTSPMRDRLIKILSALFSILSKCAAALINISDLVLVELDRRRQLQC